MYLEDKRISIISTLESLFKGAGILFPLIFNSIVLISTDGNKVDLFGLSFPSPPLWTQIIPGIHFLADYIARLFSFHGVVTILISITLIGIGVLFESWKENIQKEKEHGGN